MMKVSVIVPCYNVQSYICQCVDTILSQDLDDFEVILIDDGSNDMSGKIIDEYAYNDNRVVAIRRSNGGSAAARNDGIIVARGKYLYFVDPDDYIFTTDYLSRLYEEIEQNQADMVLINHTRFYKNNSVRVKFVFDMSMSTQTTGDILLYLVKSNKMPNAPWTRIVKKDIVLNNNILFDTYFRRSQDIEWNFRLLPLINHIRLFNYPMYMYRVSNTSGKTNWVYRHGLILKHYDKLIENNSMDVSMKKALLSILSYQWYLCLYETSAICNRIERRYAQHKLKELRGVTKYSISLHTYIMRVAVTLFGVKISSKIISMFYRVFYLKSNT